MATAAESHCITNRNSAMSCVVESQNVILCNNGAILMTDVLRVQTEDHYIPISTMRTNIIRATITTSTVVVANVPLSNSQV